jgi:Lon protease-like protein
MALREIPLFPLHAVLFPHTPLNLRVFEDRYLLMVERCMKQEQPFGVILIRSGQEVGESAVPEEVGTLAEIRSSTHQNDQYLLEVEGTRRFHLVDYRQCPEQYLVGTTEPIRDVPYDPSIVLPLAQEVRRLFHSYFEGLVRIAGQKAPEYQLPVDAEDLSFVIAAVLQQTSLHERQQMLGLTDTRARLHMEKSLLETELAKISGAEQSPIADVMPLVVENLREYNSLN